MSFVRRLAETQVITAERYHRKIETTDDCRQESEKREKNEMRALHAFKNINTFNVVKASFSVVSDTAAHELLGSIPRSGIVLLDFVIRNFSVAA